MKTYRTAFRLEHVRELRGVRSLKEFHQRLGGEDFISYAAVRNYHSVHNHSRRTVVRFGEETPKDERIAPAPYLARVADRFGVRLEWLATGEGPVTIEEAELQSAGQDAVEVAAKLVDSWRRGPDAFTDEVSSALKAHFGHLPSPVARAVFVHTLGRLRSNPALVIRGEDRSPDALAAILAQPVREVAAREGVQVTTMLLDQYLIDVVPALGRWLEDAILTSVELGRVQRVADIDPGTPDVRGEADG